MSVPDPVCYVCGQQIQRGEPYSADTIGSTLSLKHAPCVLSPRHTVSVKGGVGTTGGIKYDDDKPPMDLIPHDALVEIAKVFGFGAKKYERGNWAKGISYSRCLAAIDRHKGAYNAGEDKDPETGISHMASVAVNAMFILWFEKHRPDMDDRWEKAVKK